MLLFLRLVLCRPIRFTLCFEQVTNALYASLQVRPQA